MGKNALYLFYKNFCSMCVKKKQYFLHTLLSNF